jgi:hypothetical protein
VPRPRHLVLLPLREGGGRYPLPISGALTRGEYGDWVEIVTALRAVYAAEGVDASPLGP